METTPETPHPAELELARLRAGMAAGLTVEQSARLQGTTPEELTADATTLAAELGVTSAPASAPRSGGNQGPEVGTPTGLAAGAELYRERHGTPHGEHRQAPTYGQNPFATRTYEMNGR
ncbi:hypothetical protein [Streptomyces hilarionis]|uniref:hypothetical protein n=1 Tax=Streptomyces hilarionis TaxID=2839954 RepID=UPI00211A1B62|nr:hypothetical protein [Streptomyces hilarionis]MCQ9134132.1 hypothetical protein [Streptomyces hilarionis]